MRLGTYINSPARQRPGLLKRIEALQLEVRLMSQDCSALQGLDAQTIAIRMDRAERRVTMLRHGVSLVRSEAKMIVAAENRLAAAGKVVCQ